VNFVLDFATKLKEKTWTSFACGKCPNSLLWNLLHDTITSKWKEKKMIMTSSTIDIFAHFHIEYYTLLKHSISWHCSLHHKNLCVFSNWFKLGKWDDRTRIIGMEIVHANRVKDIQGYTWSDDKHSPSKPSSPSHLTSKTWYLVLLWVLNALKVHWKCNKIGNINWNNWSNQVVKANCKERWWNFVRDDLEGQIEHIVCLPMLPR
jgi:hypothetical protein